MKCIGIGAFAESPEMVGQLIVHLLRDVEKYLKLSNTPAARFSREAMGDPRFVFDLRNGREPRPQTIKRVRAFLETGQ